MKRAVKAREQIVAMYDERFFRMWEFYLAGGIVAFENGAMNNYQVQYIRDRRALPITRAYLAEAEERYRQASAAPARQRRAKAPPSRALNPPAGALPKLLQPTV